MTNSATIARPFLVRGRTDEVLSQVQGLPLFFGAFLLREAGNGRSEGRGKKSGVSVVGQPGLIRGARHRSWKHKADLFRWSDKEKAALSKTRQNQAKRPEHTLDLFIGVRIPASQPIATSIRCWRWR